MARVLHYVSREAKLTQGELGKNDSSSLILCLRPTIADCMWCILVADYIPSLNCYRMCV